MELRVLKYFLVVAREQNITRAANVLHLTQPTLSRQLAALEEELGTKLFDRGSKKILLTEDGLLLRRRAMEILELEEKTVSEIKKHDDLVEGSVSIGCGEYHAVDELAKICASYHKKYPAVQIRLHTANADLTYEMMNNGLLDIGLFNEPANTLGLDYIRFSEDEVWSVGMRPDDPLAGKEYITKEDLADKPLIMPDRLSVQSELAGWFGKMYRKLNVAYTSNLAMNAATITQNGLAYHLCGNRTMESWDPQKIITRKLYPELRYTTIIAWRRNVPNSAALNKFIEEIHLYHDMQA